MRSLTEDIKANFGNRSSFGGGHERPYRHWFVHDVFPQGVYEDAEGHALPGRRPGRRFRHARGAQSPTASISPARTSSRSRAARAAAEAFQDARNRCGSSTRSSADRSTNTFVRIEYAQDIDGFWLKPHTDIGVKMFTMLIYMSDDPAPRRPRHRHLRRSENSHVARSPFEPNSAMIFVPSKQTWHGFEKRPIQGVRRSIIVNYVTNAWRAREQLAFPHSPVSPN